jgi:3-deoxy-D-manno-octulosonic-acid transferase
VPEVLKLVAARGYVPCTLSGAGSGQVLVVDEFGKLESIYRAADVVIIGGTFVPHGGHNMLEAARWGKPVLFGRSIDSFRDCALGLLARDAAVQVPTTADLETRLRDLLHSPDERSRLGARALAAWREGSGAVHRYTHVVTRALRKENAPHG